MLSPFPEDWEEMIPSRQAVAEAGSVRKTSPTNKPLIIKMFRMTSGTWKGSLE